jgi:peptidoglycan/LPS O-acetylase OafA/YrhL
MSYDEFQATRYFPSLDALRGVAILAVLWHHTEEATVLAPVFVTRGYLGVDLFFVLSGFLITTILIRERIRTGSISFRNFYVRRTLRIFPLYYAFLLYLCVIALLRANTIASEKFFDALPYYATYTSNWIPGQVREPSFFRSWSLSVEEQFYFAWPTLFVVLGSRALWALPGFVVLVLLGLLGVLGTDAQPLFRHLAHFSSIAIGAILALLLSRPREYHILSSLFGRRGSALAVLVVLVTLLSIPGRIDSFFMLAVHLSLAALVCSVVVRNDHNLSRITSARLLVHIGIVSYGIYVLHGALDGIAQRSSSFAGRYIFGPDYGPVPGVRFVVLTVISTLTATISYYYFESYFLRLKEKFSNQG